MFESCKMYVEEGRIHKPAIGVAWQRDYSNTEYGIWYRNCMQKADTRSSVKELPRLLLKFKVQYRIYKSPPVVFVLNHMNLIQASALYVFNLSKPNDIYICRTAALTSRRYILDIYSTNIHTEYFKHAA